MKYPPAPRSAQVDDLHGVRVEDPFRPLEDSNSPETRQWIDAENELTDRYLASSPQRISFRQRLAEITNYARQSAPRKRGGRYFLFKNSGLENQDRLYWRRTLKGADTELLNPNLLSSDGTAAMISSVVSPDGRHLAYQISKSGSDWVEIRVRKIDGAQDLADRLEWVKFSGIGWSKDGTGFYYGRFEAPAAGSELQGVNRFQKLYFHKLGTEQATDRLVYERPDDGEVGAIAHVTEDGRYLVITGWRGTSTKRTVEFMDLTKGDLKARPLVGEFLAGFHFLGSEGSKFYFHTTLEAGRGRVVEIDVERGLSSLKSIIPETEGTLESADYLNRHFVVRYLVDAAAELKIFSRDGRLVKDVALPGVGCVMSSITNQGDTEYFFTFENFTTPPTACRIEVPLGRVEVLHRPTTQFDASAFETRRVFYASKDGTKIPLFIACRKGVRLDGNNPVMLYGYGGFNASVLPWFRVSRISWMESSGIYASACLRGGGEFGEAWHKAGTKEKKQNVFDDFIAAAEWMVKEKYTRPAKLAINGGSNGGLLVGACMTQRPELFGAVVAAVGVFDMMRFHKFTIGWAWVTDYGSPDDAVDCAILLKYSPLHNLKKGARYPATLITTGDHDDRVVPAHSFKFAAALQEAQGGPQPILIRIDTKSGHGLGKPVGKLIDETADIYTFIHTALGR